MLGVGVSLESTAPYQVKIALDDRIGGPSAGLMFALGILDKLGPDDLTGGRFIAGTGTIDVTGEVGPIGGIPLKLIAAKDEGRDRVPGAVRQLRRGQPQPAGRAST